MTRDLSKLKEGDTFVPTSWDDAHPGRFLKASDLEAAGGTLTLKVARVYVEHMGMKKKNGVATADTRNMLAFDDYPKEYALQKTNEMLIQAMFGSKPADIVGKRITFGIGQDYNVALNRVAPCVRVSGSPDISEPIKVTVTYSAKTRKAPKDFTLRVTEGESAELRDDCTVALAGISSCVTLEALNVMVESLREHQWTPRAKAEIKKTINEANTRLKGAAQ